MSSFARRSRLMLSIAALAIVAVGSLSRVDLLLPPLLRTEICDGLHVPAGMLLCFVTTLWLPATGRALVQAALAVLVASVLLEALQWQVGRMPAWRDVLLSTAGAALTSGILYHRQAARSGLKRPLASLGVALFVVATLPIMNKLAAIEESRALWPQLSNFESSQQDALWKPYPDAVITHAQHGELQTAMGMLDQSFLRVESPTRPPVVRHWVVSPDWSAMKTFCLEARYPRPGHLRVVFHHGDASALIPEPGTVSDDQWPTQEYELTPYWKRHCTPVAAVGAGSGATLDATSVRALTLSVLPGPAVAAGSQAPPLTSADPGSDNATALRLDIDNVRLYP